MPLIAQRTVRVKGYREMTRAFGKAEKQTKREMQDALKDVAEPIRADAQLLAGTRIKNIGRRWSLMRVGLTSTTLYVAPVERGRRSRGLRSLARPNLAGLLIDRAMQPALDDNERDVADRFDDALAHIERTWGNT